MAYVLRMDLLLQQKNYMPLIVQRSRITNDNLLCEKKYGIRNDMMQNNIYYSL